MVDVCAGGHIEILKKKEENVQEFHGRVLVKTLLRGP